MLKILAIKFPSISRDAKYTQQVDPAISRHWTNQKLNLIRCTFKLVGSDDTVVPEQGRTFLQQVKSRDNETSS